MQTKKENQLEEIACKVKEETNWFIYGSKSWLWLSFTSNHFLQMLFWFWIFFFFTFSKWTRTRSNQLISNVKKWPLFYAATSSNTFESRIHMQIHSHIFPLQSCEMPIHRNRSCVGNFSQIIAYPINLIRLNAIAAFQGRLLKTHLWVKKSYGQGWNGLILYTTT